MIKERRGGRGNQRGRAGGQRRAISQRRRRAGAVGWEDGVEGGEGRRESRGGVQERAGAECSHGWKRRKSLILERKGKIRRNK